MFTRLRLGIALFAMFTMPLLAQEQRKFTVTTNESASGELKVFSIEEPDPAQIISQALSLTGPQTANLQTFLDARDKEMEFIDRDIERRQQALERALEQPNPVAFEVGTLMVSIRELESKKELVRETLQRNVESILTANQKTILTTIKNAVSQAEALRMTGLLPSEPEHYLFGGIEGKAGWVAGTVEHRIQSQP